MSRRQKPARDIADPISAEFHPDRWPFYHMARLIGLYHLRLDAVLKPIGMDVPRWRVLSILSIYGATTITRLSDEAVTKISTMAKIIQRMAAQNLVTTEISAQDARATEVSITERGRGVLDQVRVKVGSISMRAFHDIPESDLLKLTAVASQIYENLV